MEAAELARVRSLVHAKLERVKAALEQNLQLGAGDVDDFAGDVAGLLRYQEDEERGEFRRLDRATQLTRSRNNSSQTC
jgi:hypothetical protein